VSGGRERERKSVCLEREREHRKYACKGKGNVKNWERMRKYNVLKQKEEEEK